MATSSRRAGERAPKPLHVAISLGKADVAAVPGIGPDDIERVHLDLCKRLLQRGHVLVYGGDLKPTGFVEELIGLAAESADDPAAVRRAPEQKIRNGVAWPIHLQYDAADLARRHLAAMFERYEPPEDVELTPEQRTTFVPPDTPQRRFWWSRSLTAMRERLDATTDARVVVCGRGIGSSGAVPGIFEEAVIAVRAGTPLFLVGGLGGVAVPLIEAVRRGTTDVFTRAAQCAHPPMAEFYAYLDRIGRGDLADFAGMVKSLHDAGIAGLGNGLTAAENERLFTERDWPTAAELLLDGLDRLQD